MIAFREGGKPGEDSPRSVLALRAGGVFIGFIHRPQKFKFAVAIGAKVFVDRHLISSG